MDDQTTKPLVLLGDLTAAQVSGLVHLRNGRWAELASTTVNRLRSKGLAEGRGATLKLTEEGTRLCHQALGEKTPALALPKGAIDLLRSLPREVTRDDETNVLRVLAKHQGGWCVQGGASFPNWWYRTPQGDKLVEESP